MSSESSHWFWKWGYLAAIPIILLMVWISKSEDIKKQNNVNPQVFVFFKQVEQDCLAESFDNQSKKCAQILKHQNECKRISSNCNSLTFYQLLEGLEFKLPQYYQNSTVSK